MTQQPDFVAQPGAANAPTGIIMYSAVWCGDCRRSKNWLKTNGVAYHEIDIDDNEPAAEYVMRVNHGQRAIPTIVFPDGAILVEPSNRELAVQVERSLGIATPDSQRR